VGDVRADDQILHEETGIAFETRAERWRDLKLALLMDRQLRARGARRTALARWSAVRASLASSMPLG